MNRIWPLAMALTAYGPTALAEEPPSTTNSSAEAKSDKKSERSSRIEWAGVPIVGGNSDFGWGGGALVSAIRPSKENDKANEWSAELAAVAMFSGESFEPGFQDYYLKTVLDDTLADGLRLTLRPSFTQVVGVNYYGLGNAAARGGPTLPDPDGPDRMYYDYTHTDLTMRAFFSHDFSHRVRMMSGVILTYAWMDVADGSSLAIDAREGTEEAQSLLSGVDNHAFSAFVWSLEFDTRDEEVHPHRGLYQTTTLTFAPGGVGSLTETWGRVFGALRGYHGFWNDRWVLAGRAMVDVLVGPPPVYELSRFDNFSNAFGGEKGVRGIEAQRYYGKVKLLGNLESRIAICEFNLLGRVTLIANQFFDFGRLWADFGASEALDGAGAGIKYSVGGGLRFLFEDSFIVAFDAGWSPDAQPVGVYLTSGHAF